MRGAHPGSFEAAHARVQGKRWQAAETGEHYDLVVVGAGISGLAAAYFYRRDVDPGARILILDNHDDFGGHAKRNEFSHGDQAVIGFGGTMLMEAPGSYPPVARQLVAELGIRADSYHQYYDENLFASLGLGRASFFDRETFGADFLASHEPTGAPATEGSPLDKRTRNELNRLFDDRVDYLAGKSPLERRRVLQALSYEEYLSSYGGVGPIALTYLRKRPHGVWGTGTDALPALMAWASDYPGFASMELGYDDSLFGSLDDSIFHFPDGNASIARLLVRAMIPSAAEGDSMEDIVTARFQYANLDKPGSATRIRLSSTVVHMAHQRGHLSQPVELSYIRQGRAYTVIADRVVWAGYQAMVPHVCPDVPSAQSVALSNCQRAPLVYTNVLIRDWQSFVELGVHRIYCPGSFFQSVRIDTPVSMGSYRFSQSPDQPVLLHLQHIPTQPGLPAAEQFKAGRRALLQRTFASFEYEVRSQLDRLLGPGGFDVAKDVLAITVNRWPHGYAYATDPKSGEVVWWPELWHGDSRPWEEARERLGNIAFAGTDAASNAMTEAAIEEAARAVRSLASERPT